MNPDLATRLARTKAAAEELARLNPTLRFLYNDGSVVLEHGEPARLMLCCSWTITGQFIGETARLDVTEIFNRAAAFVA